MRKARRGDDGGELRDPDEVRRGPGPFARVRGFITRNNLPVWAQLAILAVSLTVATYEWWRGFEAQRAAEADRVMIERPLLRCYYIELPIDDYEKPFPETKVTLVETAASKAYWRLERVHGNVEHELNCCFIENVGREMVQDAHLHLLIHTKGSARPRSADVSLEAIAPKETVCVPLAVWTLRTTAETGTYLTQEGGQDDGYPIVDIVDMTYKDARGNGARYVPRPAEPDVIYYLNGYGSRG